MTPEQKKMLDDLGYYPEVSASGERKLDYQGEPSYSGNARAGMVAQLMDNLNVRAGVSGYGYKNPGSGAKLVPTHVDANLKYGDFEIGGRFNPFNSDSVAANLKYKTDRYGDFAIDGNYDPNSKDYNVFAKWIKRF